MIDERYQFKDDDAQRALKTIAVQIEEQIPDGMGFTLFLFHWRDGGLFYISNAERADMIVAVRAWLAKQEAAQNPDAKVQP